MGYEGRRKTWATEADKIPKKCKDHVVILQLSFDISWIFHALVLHIPDVSKNARLLI